MLTSLGVQKVIADYCAGSDVSTSIELIINYIKLKEKAIELGVCDDRKTYRMAKQFLEGL